MMSVLYVILAAVIQGITEFLPVSSFGHTETLAKLFGISRDTGLLLETMLHLGTAGAVVFLFKKDLKRVCLEIAGMVMDIIGNVHLYIHNKRTGEELHYTRIVSGTYRRFAALLLLSVLPTALLGFSARRLVEMTAVSQIAPGIGFLISGIFLLVTDLNNTGGQKGPKDAEYNSAMWIGISQGLAVFPGVSRMGITICTALFCGFSRKFAVRYSIFMSLPAFVGAFLAEAGQFAGSGMSVGTGFTYFLGMIIAGLVGCLAIRFVTDLVQHVKMRYFAYYSFLIGAVALAVNYL